MVKFILKPILILCLMLSVNFTHAQPGGGGPGGGGDPDNPVPLGGIEILLLAGAALGVRKIVSRKK